VSKLSCRGASNLADGSPGDFALRTAGLLWVVVRETFGRGLTTRRNRLAPFIISCIFTPAVRGLAN
jgi:hypothetical protein